MNRNVLGRFDSKPDPISTNFQNGDLDVVGENDLLVFLTTNDEHSSVPLHETVNFKEKYGSEKNTLTFVFKRFKFLGHSGKLVELFT